MKKESHLELVTITACANVTPAMADVNVLQMLSETNAINVLQDTRVWSKVLVVWLACVTKLVSKSKPYVTR